MDIQLEESGSGGSLVVEGNDLKVIEGLQNMVYIALFGGNIEESTPVQRVDNEQAFDFWGNKLLHPDNPSVQFNSLTERTLGNIALTSSGRVQVEEAVKKDLEFMGDFAEVTVNASITDVDKIMILVRVRQPDNIEEKEFQFLWDATKNELL